MLSETKMNTFGVDVQESRYTLIRLEASHGDSVPTLRLRRIVQGNGHTWKAEPEMFAVDIEHLSNLMNALRYICEVCEREGVLAPDCDRLEGSRPPALHAVEDDVERPDQDRPGRHDREDF